MPLELFDDPDQFEDRTPDEWIALCSANQASRRQDMPGPGPPPGTRIRTAEASSAGDRGGSKSLSGTSRGAREERGVGGEACGPPPEDATSVAWDADVLHFTGERWGMVPCLVKGYDAKNRRFLVELGDGSQKLVRRLALRFYAENSE